MPDESLDPDLAALSAALGGLTPKPTALSRDRLLYEAGRRSAARRPVAWPIVAGLFAVLSAGLGARLMTVPPRVETVFVSGASRGRQPPEDFVKPPENLVALPENSVTHSPGAFAPGSPGAGYLHLRDQVVRFGADSLPEITSGPAGPPPLVEQLLGLPAGTLNDAQKSRWEHQLFQGGV